jgi:small nuclear ribonucleoprotein (snRNP)-like protein
MKTIIYYLILVIIVIYFGSFYKKLIDQKAFIETFDARFRNNAVLRNYDTYNNSYLNLVKNNDSLDQSFKNNKYVSFYDTIFNNFFRLKDETAKIAPEIRRRNDILTRDTNQFKGELANDRNFIESRSNEIIKKYKANIDANFKDASNLRPDENSNCSYWAGIGECNNNPGYMLYRCATSCANVNSKPVQQISDNPSHMMNYRGQFGKIFSILVQGQNSGTIWGTDIYTDDSYIGKAAVYDGRVNMGQTKTLYIEMLPAQSSYRGGQQNGITSNAYGYWGGSYKFVNAPRVSPTENLKRTLDNLINQNTQPEANKFIDGIPSNRDVISKVDTAYNKNLQQNQNALNAMALTFQGDLNQAVSSAIDGTVRNLPNLNVGNNPGILVRIYSSSQPIANNAPKLSGTMMNEYVIPAINYFATSGIDSLFSGKKISGMYRYLEFFGTIVIPRDVVVIEFKVESAAGARLFFAGAIAINDFSPNKAVDANSGLNYVVPGQKVPFKLQILEGLDNTTNYVMLKWRLNQKGAYVVIPREYFFLPDMNMR